ncbi:hypothetical protein SDC9_84664 [bioreactor metagenome]|uniref:Uncharacterized protein n=1 Tax=bioreactor metagenome TaxID=1076179 RepID=A0A644ZDR8_9ZZZZ
MLLCAEEEEREFVLRRYSRFVLPADGNVEANRESREVFCAAAAAQIYDLVELKEQAFDQFQRGFVCQCTGSEISFIIRVEILIHPPGRKRGGVALHLENDIQKPARLHRFTEGLRRALAQRVAHAGNLQEFFLAGRRLRHLARKRGIAAHEQASPLE